MTAFVRAFLSCNGCGEMFDTSTVPSAKTAAEARDDASRNGWVRKSGGRDLCQSCATAQKEAGR